MSNRYRVVKFNGNNLKDYIEYLKVIKLNEKPINPPLRFFKSVWFSEMITIDSEIAYNKWCEYIKRWEKNLEKG